MIEKTTAFAPIFRQKLNRLKKDIKKLRKEKGKKEYIKKCIREAKQLRNLLKDSSQKELYLHIRLDGNEVHLLDKHPCLVVKKISIERGILKIALNYFDMGPQK